jgi:hypothetical protein
VASAAHNGDYYDIVIGGIDYGSDAFAAVVTPSNPHRIPTTSSAGGHLVVDFWDGATNDNALSRFSFVVHEVGFHFTP